MSLESQPSGSSLGSAACGQYVVTILCLGGILVSSEQLKDTYQVVTDIPSGGTGSPVTLLSY